MYVRTYIYVDVCVHVFLYVFIYVYVCAFMYIYIYTYVCVCTYVYVHVYLYVKQNTKHYSDQTQLSTQLQAVELSLRNLLIPRSSNLSPFCGHQMFIAVFITARPLVTLFFIFLLFIFSVALRPNAGHGLLILEVSRSHTTTQHSR